MLVQLLFSWDGLGGGSVRIANGGHAADGRTVIPENAEGGGELQMDTAVLRGVWVAFSAGRHIFLRFFYFGQNLVQVPDHGLSQLARAERVVSEEEASVDDQIRVEEGADGLGRVQVVDHDLPAQVETEEEEIFPGLDVPDEGLSGRTPDGVDLALGEGGGIHGPPLEETASRLGPVGGQEGGILVPVDGAGHGRV